MMACSTWSWTKSAYDFLYNISENGHRTPRGYAFVTYSSATSATNAIEVLHNTRVMARPLVVRYANRMDYSRDGPSVPIPSVLRAGGKAKTKLGEQEKIKALEEKLKLLEKTSSSEFKLHQATLPVRTKPYDKAVKK